MKKALKELLPPLAVMLAIVLAVRHDAVIMSPHSGGELSMGVMVLSCLAAVVLGIRAAKKRRWFRAALMVLVLVCVGVCDQWLWMQVPPCAECEPALYQEWVEKTNKE